MTDTLDATNLKTGARLTAESWNQSGAKAVALIKGSHLVSSNPDQTFFLFSASIWPLGFYASPFTSQSGIFASLVAMKNCLYSYQSFSSTIIFSSQPRKKKKSCFSVNCSAIKRQCSTSSFHCRHLLVQSVTAKCSTSTSSAFAASLLGDLATERVHLEGTF